MRIIKYLNLMVAFVGFFNGLLKPQTFFDRLSVRTGVQIVAYVDVVSIKTYSNFTLFGLRNEKKKH